VIHRLPLDRPEPGRQLLDSMTSCKIELHKAGTTGESFCSVEVVASVDGDTPAGLALLRTLVNEFRKPDAAGGGV